MIKKNEEQTKLEFGNGDISIAGGYTTGDTVKGFVVFENQEARKIGSPGITEKGEIDLNDYDVVMTFSKKESVDALIEQLELTKTYMSCDNTEMEDKKEKKMRYKTQEDFTDRVNNLILEGKKQGFSTKNISDKWHTFGDLYYHRMILTYIVLKNYPNLSWKSKQHHDGTMFDDSFIVGISTPDGQYSYHYHLEHWGLFDIRELDKAPEYDGHKPEDITRLISLL